MKIRSILSILIALLMALSVCASAESGKYYNETGLPIVNEPITITIAGQMEENRPLESQKGLAYLEEATGIHFDVIQSIAPDAWATSFALMMSTDTLPDLLLKTMMDRSDANKWGEQGYFLDYMQYIDLMPNLAKYQEEHPDAAKMELTQDGKMYGHALNRTSARSSMLAQPNMNVKWLEAVGKAMPTTVDELYDVLVAFRDEDPNGNGEKDEIPLLLSSQAGIRTLWQIRAAYGIISCDNYFCLQADDEGNVYLAETTDAYKAYLTYMNKLYNEGLVNEDAFIVSSDEFDARLGNGTCGLSLYWNAGYRPQYKTATRLEFAETYRPWSGMTSEYTDEITMVLYPANSGQARVQINAKTEYPEAICRLIDYVFYTFEGYTLYEWGKEGIDYDVVTDEFGVSSISNAAYAPGERPVLPVGNVVGYVPTLSDQFFANATMEELEMLATQSETNANDAINEMYIRTYNSQYGFPFLAYTAEEVEKIGNKKADLTAYITAQEVAFITGEADIEEDWDTFQQTMKMMGVEDLVAIAQDAYNRLG